MRKVFLFMMVSLDGFFEGPNHDLSWHNVDHEFNEFAVDQLNEVDTLMFGRRTYQLMADFWPAAKLTDPLDKIVAEKMNNLPKVVFSKTLENMKEVKRKRNALQSQAQDIGEKVPGDDVNLNSFEDIRDTLYHSLKYSLPGEQQEYMRQLIVSIYVGERRKALVNGHIPLIEQPQNIQYESIGRNSWSS